MLASDTFKPTAGMISAAKRGLDLRSEFNRGGTPVGIARARSISNGQNLPMSTVKEMYSFFARHEVDKSGKDFDNAAKPSNGKIAKLLWGGDAGETWASAIRDRAIAAEVW